VESGPYGGRICVAGWSGAPCAAARRWLARGSPARARVAATAGQAAVSGVRHRRGVSGRRVAAIFDAPADTLADRRVALSELGGDGWVGRLVDGPGPAGGAVLLDRVERALVAGAERTNTSAAQLVGEVQRGLRQGHSVATVAARLAVDRRTLATLFHREVGFGLKRYARLARFEAALRAVRAKDAPSLGVVAANLGFADQSHLSREFRCFAGFSPGRLHRVPGPSPWHVIHDETFKTARLGAGTLRS
jgi:AraC-like DNA-binding protein